MRVGSCHGEVKGRLTKMERKASCVVMGGVVGEKKMKGKGKRNGEGLAGESRHGRRE